MSDILIELQNNIEKSNVNELQNIFYENAKKLMNEYVLVIGDKAFELTELEYYFYDKDKHPDKYTHRQEVQKDMKNNLLYIHKKGRGGIDIVFGNGIYYGGILIRGIKYNNTFIKGPTKVLNEISNTLELNLPKNDKRILLQICISKTKVYLKKQNNYNFPIYVSTRIGLEKNKKNYQKEFLNSLYRFIRKDYLLNKSNNTPKKEESRAISFLIYDQSIDNEYSIKKKIDEIKENEFIYTNIKNFKKYFT